MELAVDNGMVPVSVPELDPEAELPGRISYSPYRNIAATPVTKMTTTTIDAARTAESAPLSRETGVMTNLELVRCSCIYPLPDDRN